MPEHTVKERLRAATENPLTDRLAALEANEQGGGAAPVAVAEPQVIEEDIGVGEAAFSSVEAAEINMLRNKIQALKNPKFHGPLLERIETIQAEAAARLEAETATDQ